MSKFTTLRQNNSLNNLFDLAITAKKYNILADYTIELED